MSSARVSESMSLRPGRTPSASASPVVLVRFPLWARAKPLGPHRSIDRLGARPVHRAGRRGAGVADGVAAGQAEEGTVVEDRCHVPGVLDHRDRLAVGHGHPGRLLATLLGGQRSRRRCRGPRRGSGRPRRRHCRPPSPDHLRGHRGRQPLGAEVGGIRTPSHSLAPLPRRAALTWRARRRRSIDRPRASRAPTGPPAARRRRTTGGRRSRDPGRTAAMCSRRSRPRSRRTVTARAARDTR